ncbi:MAG: hypothetical protein RL680_975 [Actinomycetota bacterium]|jgi:hypothetical protein
MNDLTIGRSLRDSQLALFEQRDTEFLSHCRTIAVEVAQKVGTVSINDIRAQVLLPAHVHPSVLGSVFKSKRFQAVGFIEAAHKAAHARVVRVYKLID